MFKTKLIVMSAILAMAFCLPGAAEARGDHNWKKHRFSGWPFRAMLNHLKELENRLSVLETAPTTQQDSGTTAGPEVSFLAKMTTPPVPTSGPQTVIFDYAVHNHGSYDSSNGTFTVPASGVYQCSSVVYFNPLSKPEGSTATLQIVFESNASSGVFDLGRTAVIHPPPDPPPTFPNYSVGGEITVLLNQGDTVKMSYSGPDIGVSAFPGFNLGGTRFTCHQLYNSEGP